MQTQERLALFGCTEPLPTRQLLRAGALTCERVGGRFGPLRVNGHEVWHGMAFLLRDAAWGTPEPVFEEVSLEDAAQGLRLCLHGHIPCTPADVARGPAEGARVLLHLEIQAYFDGRWDLSVRATPTHDLRVNRCGWVLMHPLSAAGRAVEVEHVDGRISRSTLPVQVPAWPPFTGVRGLRHEYAPGRWAEAWMPGEDYEFEDQRNNADASFKTYSRSNMMPRPYFLRQGQAMERRLHLRLLGDPPAALHRWSADFATPVLPLHTTGVHFMRLGLSISTGMAEAADWRIQDVLHRWKPDFLHLTLWTQDQVSLIHWQGVKTLLKASGARLRIDLCGLESPENDLPADDVCRRLSQSLQQAGIQPAEVAALPCGQRTADLLRHWFPGAHVGGGTPHFFAQLNRLEDSGGEDFMGFTVCPIVHGADDDSVMLGLQSLPSMMETARLRHPGRAWHLGPDCLSARASPLGPQPFSDGLRRVALARRDPRTRGLFGAAWLLGHLAAALRSGVDALTLPPLMGEDGLGQLSPEGWLGTPSAAWLETCLSWRGVRLMEWTTPHATHANFTAWPLVAISGIGRDGLQVLMANLASSAQKVHWPHGGHWACLDAQAWQQHLSNPASSAWRATGPCPPEIVLGPYALARIDLPNSSETEHAARH